jgi:hypothetical protein
MSSETTPCSSQLPPSSAAAAGEALDPPSLEGIESQPLEEAASPGVGGPEGEHLGPHLGFWQDPVVQNYLPLGTSVAFHLILIIGGILSFKTYQKITQPMQEQVIIPEAAIVEGGEVGGIPNPGLGSDPNMAAAQNVDPNVSSTDNWADKRSESLTTTLMNGGSSDDATDSVIGLGARGGVTGTGAPGPGGAGGEGTEALAPFGVPGGGQGLGPKSPFMGISGNARKVVYICDASGSMIDKIETLKQELRKSVDVLKPIQGFNVIFFKEGAFKALSTSDQLLMANADAKRQAFEFIRSMYIGPSSDPIAAIDLAFKEKPDLIYLLTDGEFDNNKAVFDRIGTVNKDKRVKINTILLLPSRESADDSQELKRAEKDLKKIAVENGGTFKPVRVGG